MSNRVLRGVTERGLPSKGPDSALSRQRLERDYSNLFKERKEIMLTDLKQGMALIVHKTETTDHEVESRKEPNGSPGVESVVTSMESSQPV